MSLRRCLICGCPIEDEGTLEYHTKCAKTFFGSKRIPVFPYRTSEINELAKSLVLSRVSVPGVQAKLSVHLEHTDEVDRFTIVGFEGDYILKLPTATYPEIIEAEHFGMMLSSLCGLKTTEYALFRLESGDFGYLTKRLDRVDGVKHMLDMCQLTLRDTERKYTGSYEQIAKAIKAMSATSGLDLSEFFNEVVFAYLIGNSDMHLKNFSMLREHNGDWRLAAGYDLLPVKMLMPQDLDELALNLNGKKRHLARKDFAAFAEVCAIPSARFDRTLDRFLGVFEKRLPKALARSFLSDTFKTSLLESINARMAVFRSLH